jgi:ATP synthase protein I
LSGKPKKGQDPSAPTEFNLLVTASSIGLAVVIAIVLGLGLGLLLDSRLGTRPWLTIIGLLMGIVAGFRNLWVMAARLERGQAKKWPLLKSQGDGSRSELSLPTPPAPKGPEAPPGAGDDDDFGDLDGFDDDDFDDDEKTR